MPHPYRSDFCSHECLGFAGYVVGVTTICCPKEMTFNSATNEECELSKSDDRRRPGEGKGFSAQKGQHFETENHSYQHGATCTY